MRLYCRGKPVPPNNNHIFFNFLAANTVVEPTLVAELLRTLMGRYQVGGWMGFVGCVRAWDGGSG